MTMSTLIQMEINKFESNVRSLSASFRSARTVQELKTRYQGLVGAAPATVRSICRSLPSNSDARHTANLRATELVRDAGHALQAASESGIEEEAFQKLRMKFITEVLHPCRGDFVLAYQQGGRLLHSIMATRHKEKGLASVDGVAADVNSQYPADRPSN